MDRYIIQLLEDIEDVIFKRWKKCPPHLYQADTNDPFLIPPKALEEQLETLPELLGSGEDLEHMFDEMKRWVRGEANHNMFYHFGLEPVQFPPENRLTDHHLEALNNAILRLWASFNFGTSFPDNIPPRTLYPLLLRQMQKDCVVVDYGHLGIELCDLNPENCPFGSAYCTCKDLTSSEE